MRDKSDELRFTLHFSAVDPRHRQAAAILNSQGRRSKAPYLVEAILHYERCEKLPDAQNAGLEAMVENIVRRLMGSADIAGSVPAPLAAPLPGKPAVVQDADFNEAVSALGQDGLAVIAGTMAQFRNKK